jgi:hypothetical protein
MVVRIMVVRIRFGRGRQVQRGKGKNRAVALAFGALLTPFAVMAAVLGFWRLAADLKLAGAFAISSGLFSHWQVWMFFAAVLQWGSWALNRYGHDRDRARS